LGAQRTGKKIALFMLRKFPGNAPPQLEQNCGITCEKLRVPADGTTDWSDEETVNLFGMKYPKFGVEAG
jgi:hypothetical protein